MSTAEDIDIAIPFATIYNDTYHTIDLVSCTGNNTRINSQDHIFIEDGRFTYMIIDDKLKKNIGGEGCPITKLLDHNITITLVDKEIIIKSTGLGSINIDAEEL